MRQNVGKKKLKKYQDMTGLAIIAAQVRGNTDHRVDLFIDGGDIYKYYPRTGDLIKQDNITWIENIQK